MRKRLLVWLAAAVMFIIPASSAAQVGQTAVLQGTVSDSSGAGVPGATVTASGSAIIGGSRTAVTEANGTYRFPALPPGTYTVTVELQGFTTGKRDNVQLLLGQTITTDMTLSVGALSESVMVSGSAPVVDVKSSSAQKNLSTEIMEFVPFTNRFGPAAMLLAPGVNPNNYSSYGSGGSSSNSYMIDGVDVSDPEGGTIWVFANHNWIQEVQVIGLGANAEFGGFTGVASNSLFRSGSNLFTGLVESIFENDALTGNNRSAAIIAENPDLTAPKTFYSTDSTAQIGGPIRRDKAWFFTSVQFFKPKTAPAGYPKPKPSYLTTAQWDAKGPEARQETSPRFLFKPTVKLGQNDQLTGFLQVDSYTVDGRGAGATVGPIATLHQESPEAAWNVNYTKVLSTSTVADVKYSGYWGYYYLSPYAGDNVVGYFDIADDVYHTNSYYYYKADRTRHQGNASVSHFASGFAGDHSLKFGAEIERSFIKSELGYPGGMYGFSDGGVPYYAYVWDGYLRDTINSRYTGFLQDSWQINNRLTLNPGMRVDHNRGTIKGGDTVFRTTSWAPRVGFAFDVFGSGKSVLKGHWGRYFDGAKSNYYQQLVPSNVYYGAYLNAAGSIDSELYVIRPGGVTHTMDPDIKHPSMDQAIVGWDQELFSNFKVGITGIWRENRNFIDDVLVDTSGFIPVVRRDPGPDNITGNGDDPGGNLTFFRQTTDPLNNRFYITNPEGAFRDYKGVEFLAEKRWNNRWMLQASWVISEITGNYNNTGNAGNTAEFNNPNLDPRFSPFREGALTNDNTHIAKVLGAVRGPWDVVLSGAFFNTSGATFNRTVRTRLDSQREVFAEPRGSQRYDSRRTLDTKLEKQFKMADRGRLGLTFEAFNLFNDDAITSRTTRSGSTYFRPTGLVQARRYRVGAVYRF
ncbi:MAG: TonB-dependent receptor [Acidobacteriota bacterium]|nr:TonB-dependent receptor [Acidobacteriota bacterium]